MLEFLMVSVGIFLLSISALILVIVWIMVQTWRAGRRMIAEEKRARRLRPAQGGSGTQPIPPQVQGSQVP